MPTVKIALSAAGTADRQDRYFLYCYLSCAGFGKVLRLFSAAQEVKNPIRYDPIGFKDDSSKLLPVRPTIGPDHNLNTKKAFTIRTL
jgi:hypothetical protein